jgi:Protein of unknown function (DUF1552)
VNRSQKILRRALLQGAAGAALCLPILEALAPRDSRAGNPTAPKRMIFIFAPVGFKHTSSYQPTDTPSNGCPYTLPTVLAPLAPLQKKVTLIGNLQNNICVAGGGDGHAAGTGALLTCQPANETGSTVTNGISVDQVYANTLSTPISSLVLGVDDSYNNSQPTLGSNISWQNTTTPLASESDPVRLWGRLFASLSLTPAQLAALRKQQTSVLDYVNQSATALRGKLGSGDQARVDQYVAGIAALQSKLGANSSCVTPIPSSPTVTFTTDGTPDVVNTTGLNATIDTMSDMIAHAFACDLTRVATFKLGGLQTTDFQFLGFPDQHHALSHVPDDPTVDPSCGLTNGQKLDAICTWEMQRIYHMLSALDAIKDVDGNTILDNTLVFVSSDVGDGSLHTHDQMPVILAGGGGKTLKMGQHVVAAGTPPFASLFVSMLQWAGMNVTTFGAEKAGPLADIHV